MAIARRIAYCRGWTEDLPILKITAHCARKGTTWEELLAERRQRILADINVATAKGVEIGPLVNPIVARSDGPVRYVDHATTPELRLKYAADPNVDETRIVEIDAVWGDATLAEALGGEQSVDYVVASHVVEHVPDLITWLAEIETILKADGSLRLAIPDRRFTFDYFRRESGLSDVLDAWLRKARKPLPFHILDHFANISEMDLVRAWQGGIRREDFKPLHASQIAVTVANAALVNGSFHDSHCWVFTPRSFGELMSRLAADGYVRYACTHFIDTPYMDHEFIVALSPSTDTLANAASWREMAAAAHDLPLAPPPVWRRLQQRWRTSKS